MVDIHTIQDTIHRRKIYSRKKRSCNLSTFESTMNTSSLASSLFYHVPIPARDAPTTAGAVASASVMPYAQSTLYTDRKTHAHTHSTAHKHSHILEIDCQTNICFYFVSYLSKVLYDIRCRFCIFRSVSGSKSTDDNDYFVYYYRIMWLVDIDEFSHLAFNRMTVLRAANDAEYWRE